MGDPDFGELPTFPACTCGSVEGLRPTLRRSRTPVRTERVCAARQATRWMSEDVAARLLDVSLAEMRCGSVSVDRLDVFRCNACSAEHRAPEGTCNVPPGWIRITADLGDENGVAQDVDLADDAFAHFCADCQNELLGRIVEWKR